MSTARRVASAARRRLGRLRRRAPAPADPRGGLSIPEAIVAAQEAAQQHLADGTLVMGRHSYYAPVVHKYKGDTNRIVIGNYCSVAADAHFYVGGMHPLHWVSTYGLREMFELPGAFVGEMPASRGDVEVGHDCWITEGATVLSGVRIGNGAVVATRAVVTRDVAPYAIVAGNPAREIGRRFSDEQIAALERIAWWHWDHEVVLERVDQLNGASVDDFIAAYDPGPSS
jgi:acetyltransferase-like isoleucine patch superfamily enzyme